MGFRKYGIPFFAGGAPVAILVSVSSIIKCSFCLLIGQGGKCCTIAVLTARHTPLQWFKAFFVLNLFL